MGLAEAEPEGGYPGSSSRSGVAFADFPGEFRASHRPEPSPRAAGASSLGRETLAVLCFGRLIPERGILGGIQPPSQSSGCSHLPAFLSFL